VKVSAPSAFIKSVKPTPASSPVLFFDTIACARPKASALNQTLTAPDASA
jgi:hypothetical protein